MPISPHAAEYAEPSRMRVGYVITTPEVRSPLMPGVRGDFGENLAVLKELGYDTLEVAMRDPGDPDAQGVEAEIARSGLSVTMIGSAPSELQDGVVMCHPDAQHPRGGRRPSARPHRCGRETRRARREHRAVSRHVHSRRDVGDLERLDARRHARGCGLRRKARHENLHRALQPLRDELHQHRAPGDGIREGRKPRGPRPDDRQLLDEFGGRLHTRGHLRRARVG